MSFTDLNAKHALNQRSFVSLILVAVQLWTSSYVAFKMSVRYKLKCLTVLFLLTLLCGSLDHIVWIAKCCLPTYMAMFCTVGYIPTSPSPSTPWAVVILSWKGLFHLFVGIYCIMMHIMKFVLCHCIRFNVAFSICFGICFSLDGKLLQSQLFYSQSLRLLSIAVKQLWRCVVTMKKKYNNVCANSRKWQQIFCTDNDRISLLLTASEAFKAAVVKDAIKHIIIYRTVV